mgnify:CR=1 FL=1
MELNKVKKRGGIAVRTVVLLAAGALLPSRAAAYQFIVSGHPAANESYAAASVGTVLVTATRTGRSATAPVEARSRTYGASNGIALRTDKFVGTVIHLR